MAWATHSTPPTLRKALPASPSILTSWLEPARGPLQPPLDAPALPAEGQTQHGAALAASHQVHQAHTVDGDFGAPIIMRLRRNALALREAVHLLERLRQPGTPITPAAQWLADNIALVEEQLEEATDALPARYFRRLPVLTGGASNASPRVHDMAWAWLPRVAHAFDATLLDAFFDGYQDRVEPTWGEWWALPSVLRMVLIEQLRRVGERVVADRAARSLANWVASETGAADLAHVSAALDALQRRGAERTFLLQLHLRWSELAADDARRTWLALHLPDPAATRHAQQSDEAAHDADVSQAMRSLRAVAQFDWRVWIGQRSRLAQVLRQLPTFAAENETTQNRTLHAVERWSQRSGIDEVRVARAVLAQTQAVAAAAAVRATPGGTPGYWLEGPGRRTLAESLGVALPRELAASDAWRRARLPLYLTSLAAATAAIAALTLHADAPLWLWPLMLLPASEIAVSAIHRLIAEWIAPKALPRLAFDAGIPATQRVLVAVPCLLDDTATIDTLAAQAERQHLASHEAWAQYALLSDFADAPSQVLPTDAALLAHAESVMRLLNQRHGPLADGAPRFVLLHRQRQWSDSERCWMGWERKRGKVEQLIELLAGGTADAFVTVAGLSQPVSPTPYLVVLDSDTLLPPGTLRALVGIAAHPANTPRVDGQRRRIVEGYGVLQPRVALPLPRPGSATWFHTLSVGQPGLDPYSAASSEVYQDLFEEGSFAGKGLIHVQAAHAVLSGRLPSAQVLSHDLLEGALLRCAAVSDVPVLESAPVHPDVASSRLHRWVRGDWQLLPFMLNPRHWSVSGLNLWKMADNVRRSLVAPASVGLLMASAATGTPSLAAAVLLVATALGIGPLIGALATVAGADDRVALAPLARHAGHALGRALGSTAWQFAQLLQQSLLTVDAIVRALVRQTITHRSLLAWTTAAAAEAAASRDAGTLWRRHRKVSALAVLLAVWLLLVAPQAALPGMLLCALWALSPLLTWRAAQTRPAVQERPLTAEVRADLHDMARETWRYFEHMVTAEHHHLPPDNHQRLPHAQTAARTSPTNIGMYLLAVLCARRCGFIGRQEMLQRIGATLDTLETLPRHRGHFFNWYDTQTLAVLSPAYLSTVDSGNLSAALVAVSGALRGQDDGGFDDAACNEAVKATLQRSQAQLGAARRAGLLPALDAVAADIDEVQHRLAALDHEATLDGEPPQAAEQALWQLLDHLRTLRSLTRDDEPAVDDSAALAARAEQLAWAPDYRWLYDTRRELMHIGALLDNAHAEERLDINHYDMLCSEARLASLVAIAKGDLPARHWARLKRPTFAQGADVGMQSWSGSMFEYLMPTLLVDEPAGSLLQSATQVAVAMQREQGSAWQLPWGVSESAHAERDTSLAYQYGPQGTPALALRRTPENERVIAPYASMLALQVAPWQAWYNLRRLEQAGARDRFGFIEALDHTASRQQSGTTQRRVATFMAHHQGMSLLALTNTLHDGAARRWFMGHPQVSAVSTLLHEPVPAMVKPLRPPPAWIDAGLDELGDSPPLPARALQPGTRALEPVALLSNGRSSVLLRPDGAGSTHWMGLAVSRWRDDALRGEHGSFMFLRVVGESARWHSLTQHPAPDPRAEYRCEWQPHAATFESIGSAVSTRLRVWVAPQEDVEVREITLEHTGEGPAPIVELASYFEVVLAAQAADEAHPAFSNLFVQARWDADLRALWFTRRGRLEGDRAVHAVHFLAESDADIIETRAGTDRTYALGRGRSVQSPCFHRQPQVADTGLDPIASIAVRCMLPARGPVKLRFATAVSHDPAELALIVDRHRQRVHVERAWRMASALALIALREARIDASAWHAWQLLSTPLAQALARPLPLTRAAPSIDRRCLWHLGISGEKPLLLVRVPDADGLLLADWVARVTPLWARAGLSVDVVLLDLEPASYLQPVHQGLTRLAHAHGEAATQPAHSACRLHVLRSQDLSPPEHQTLRALARVDLLADGRAPGAVMHDLRRWHAEALAQKQVHLTSDVAWAMPSAAPASAVAADLPTFDGDNGACRFTVSATQRPQRAWANVLANPEFGAHVTEAGGGHCWAHNSRLLQLTPPSNDPLTDPAAEWLLLHDLDSGQVWNAWPAPWGAAAVRYTVEQGPGWTRASHVHDGIEVTVDVCVDAATRIKQSHLQLRTTTRTRRRLRVIAVASWQIGARWADRSSIATAPIWCSESRSDDDVTVARSALALLATQTDAGIGFADSTTFLALRPRRAQPAWAFDWTCDRRELFDARGRGVVPEAFCQRSGTGLDPCAALSIEIDLAPGASEALTLLLGHADSREAAQALAVQACAVDPAQRAERARAAWRERLGGVQVRTPDPLFDALINHWLRYQTLACRLWARAGFYQIGGAYGFRDQLQDAMALTELDPQLLRQQILLCCSRQFREGDVQHWWHPPAGAGVRTRFSDDLLWLVAALLRHLDTGGDKTLLDTPAPFIEGRSVPEGAEDVYETPQASADDASVFEHAARALDRSLAFGAHGLPLMGAGDWNDGMNRVGIEGKGESVWLAWFQVSLLEPMVALAEQRGEAERAALWRGARTSLLHAIETHGWDGAWYRRAYFDDGSALGSAANAECKIDLIAQAWAVLAGGGDASRARQALQSAATHLIDDDAQLVRLLDPPLAEQRPSAGYIQAYPRGVRENGGQYTHAAAWASMAFAQSGDAARAWQAWQAASPAHRMNDAQRFKAYRLEPYAVAGDVYGHAPWRGQGGWSWYTGAAGWLLRAGVESLLGVQRRAALVRFAPMLPPEWPSAQVTLRWGGHEHVFHIVRDGHAAIADSRALAVQTWLDLDGLHENTHWTVPVTPQMGSRPTAADGGPHHAFSPPGSTVSSPQEIAS